jgi:hypothetical protein
METYHSESWFVIIILLFSSTHKCFAAVEEKGELSDLTSGITLMLGICIVLRQLIRYSRGRQCSLNKLEGTTTWVIIGTTYIEEMA